MDTLEGDDIPLIAEGRHRPQRKLFFLAMVLLGFSAYASSVCINYKLNLTSKPSYNVTSFSVFSLSVWGGPISFGVKVRICKGNCPLVIWIPKFLNYLKKPLKGSLSRGR